MSALSVSDLSVHYGPVCAIECLGFDVQAGECTSLLGVNGAGKSSAVSAIVGWVPPSAGRVSIGGREITGRPAHETVTDGLALVPERRQLFSPLTVEQNLLLGAYRSSRAHRTSTLADVLDVFPDLADRLDDRAGNLSGGQQQMLAIGRALMSCPEVLILDEPSLGLAPIIVQSLSAMLRTVLDSGAALLIVEQNSRLALDLSNEVLVLDRGSVAARGNPTELLADGSAALELFLGG